MAFPLHFLLLAVYLPVVVAMPETWAPPPGPAPPPPPYPPVDGPYGENATAGALQAFCQELLQDPESSAPVPWFCLCTRCQSDPGPKGDRGDRGLPGRPGAPGRRGLTGFRGHPGFTGRPGVKGQKGDEGDKGDRGLTGFVGPKGERGFKGEKGELGLEGRPGDQGPKGDDGVCPGDCESVPGPSGPPGMPGPAGPRGLPGTAGPPGPNGLKGDPGAAGPPGPPGRSGSPGVKGEPGPRGECNCTDGAKGGLGPQGDRGHKGDEGQAGPQGPTGPQGQKGDPGLMGRPGPCVPVIQSAFCAALTSSYPPPDAPVAFARVLYNVQGGYDPESGLYIAPVNGTYVFSYHLTVHERVLKVGLFHNFVPVVKTTDPRVLGTTSQTVVLHLARGDRVWVQVKDRITNGMYAGAESSSTFCGFLLHPDTCDVAFLRAAVPPMTSRKFSWSADESGTTEPPTESGNTEPLTAPPGVGSS